MLEKRRYTYNAVYGLKQRSQTFKNIQNKVFSPLLDSWLPLVKNQSPLKNISASNLSFINPYSAHLFLKPLRKCQQLC